MVASPSAKTTMITLWEIIYTTIIITSEFKNVSVTVGVVEEGMDDRR